MFINPSAIYSHDYSLLIHLSLAINDIPEFPFRVVRHHSIYLSSSEFSSLTYILILLFTLILYFLQYLFLLASQRIDWQFFLWNCGLPPGCHFRLFSYYHLKLWVRYGHCYKPCSITLIFCRGLESVTLLPNYIIHPTTVDT